MKPFLDSMCTKKMIRVREVCNLGSWIFSSKIIDKELFADFFKPRKTKFPEWVRITKCYAAYGVFMDALIKHMISDVFGTVNSKNWKESITEIFAETNKNETLIKMPQQKIDAKEYEKISENVIDKLLTLGPKKIAFDKEITVNLMKGVVLAGHPDIIVDDIILDIKTTQNFAKIAQESIFQISSYFAIMRAGGVPIKKIGILLPMTGELLMVNVVDNPKFLEIIKEKAIEKYTRDLAISVCTDVMLDRKIQTYVGSHIHKLSSILESLKAAYSNFLDFKCPCQIFISSPQSVNFECDSEDIANTLTFVEQHHVKGYVHAPHVINLCRLWNDSKHVECLIKTLQIAKSMGFRGVVVHVGKKVDYEFKTAIKNMYKNFLEAAKYATDECPLLLETPSGQGTELLTKVETFVAFFERAFEMCNKIGICVDTCHVFAAGYDPLEYIKKIKPGYVKLIHMNDSKFPFNSRKDRHASLGNGYIGVQKLEKIIEYCTINKLDMVQE
jgi:deoxyribonuclease-4